MSAARILGWDTSSRSGYLFAAEVPEGSTEQEGASRLLHAQVLSVDQRQHSEGLLLGISEALSATGWQLEQVAGFAVGIGPGSFTGIRIGLTTARTLGQMLCTPVVPISSLEMIEVAYRSAQGSSQDAVVILAEACMGEVYVRVSKRESGGASAEAVTKISELDRNLQGWGLHELPSNEVTVIMPDTLKKHPSLAALESNGRFRVTDWPASHGISKALAHVAERRWKEGVRHSALDVQPVYLRVSDAELHLKARENALRNAVRGG